MDWYIVVPKSAESNFRLAREQNTWGAKERQQFSHPEWGEIQKGDRVHFLTDLQWAGDGPQPREYPRLPSDRYAVRGREWVSEVVDDLHEDQRVIWEGPQGERYPYRFRFRLLQDPVDLTLRPGEGDEAVREAVRLSHNQNSRALPVPFSLREALARILREFPQARREPFSRHPLGEFVRHQLVDGLSDWPCCRHRYRVQASVGQGNWGTVPWIAIRDPNLAASVREGVYVVYLLAEDMSRVYLCLDQGVSRLLDERGRPRALEELARRKQLFRQQLGDPPPPISWEQAMVAESGLGRDYAVAAIEHIAYERDHLPEDPVLLHHLELMLARYRKLGEAGALGLKTPSFSSEDPPAPRLEEVPSPYRAPEPFTLARALEVLQTVGYQIAREDLAHVLLALMVRPFIIFSGPSGTGKTSLSRLLADLFGRRFLRVATSPAWSDPSDLFGFISPINGEHVEGALHPLLTTSGAALLCLDEFNVAKVEHYFADFLSAMDHGSGGRFWGEMATLKRLNARRASPLAVPSELWVVATMNFDDSVQSLTPRVLDRAHVIEFSVRAAQELLLTGELRWEGIEDPERFTPLSWPPFTPSEEVDPPVRAHIGLVWTALQASRGQFGHRVAQEVGRYVSWGLRWDEAFGQTPDPKEALFDQALVARILPKFHGTAQQRDIDALIRLLQVLIPEVGGGAPAVAAERQRLLEEAKNSGRYPRTVKKIETLHTRFVEDGYASFW